MKRWTEEQKAIFQQHAGKLPDEEVARLTGRSLREVISRRSHYRIRFAVTPKYAPEMVQFVKDNFRRMSNDEMAGILKERNPHLEFTKHGIRSLMVDLGLKRTEDDIKHVKQRCVERGVFKAASARAAVTLTKHKIGELCYVHYSDRRRLCIKVGKRKYRPYEIWLWEQAHGKLSKGKSVVKVNPLLPYSIDNLQLTPRADPTHKIGDLVTRMLHGFPRVYIKVSETKFVKYDIYLWEKNNGPIPVGYLVRKKDPNGPLAIENLFLSKPIAYLITASKDLNDTYILGTLSRSCYNGLGQTLKSGLIAPEIAEAFIGAQRARIEFIRASKNQKNARNSQGSPPNNQVEGTAAEDA